MIRMRLTVAVASLLIAGQACAQFTANYQTNIISGVDSNWAGSYVVGSNTVGNVLEIQNTGRLFDGIGCLGYESVAHNNYALVTGTGSSWTNQNRVFVGYSGAQNHLVISNGGVVYGATFSANLDEGTGTIGQNATATNNEVEVTGNGSLWGNYGTLIVGLRGGGNRLVITDGGSVFNYVGLVGSVSSSNSVLVAGTNSVWTCYHFLTVGWDNNVGNELIITNGGKVVATGTDRFHPGGITISRSGTGHSARVTGRGSALVASNYFSVGGSGTQCRLIVEDHGAVSCGDGGTIGGTTNGNNNSVIVDGEGSVWQSQGYLYVGLDGGSNMLVVSGGLVLATNLIVGVNSATCDNLVELDGGDLVVTNGGNGTLEVRRGKFIMNDGTLVVDRLVVTNGCGRFIRNGGTVSIGSLVLDSNLSAVGDGIPNAWKQQFGFDPLNPNVAQADPDGDGSPNLQEYLAGTSPTNSASTFRVLSVTTVGNDVRVTWTSKGGKGYQVQTNAVTGNGFADASGLITVPGSD